MSKVKPKVDLTRLASEAAKLMHDKGISDAEEAVRRILEGRKERNLEQPLKDRAAKMAAGFIGFLKVAEQQRKSQVV